MRRTLSLLLIISNSVFAQVNLNQGLMAYYPFSGNANDASGNNNNPVFNNATLTNDRFGTPNSAYHFNGTSNYIKILNSATISTGNQISLCAWVKPMGFSSAQCHGNSIIDKGVTDFLPGNYLMRYSDAAYTNFQHCSIPNPDVAHENFLANNATGPAGGYIPFIQLNNWYSVVYTYDGTTEKLYVNCQLKVTRQTAGLNFTNSTDLYLGRFFNASFPYWMDGDLDEIRIYNRPLNQQEVSVLGDCLIPTGGIINSYTPVLALNPCNNKITVEDASAFNTGDTVLMIQMKGAVIDSTNTAAFGTITDYKNAGNYEFNYVKSKAGNIIELKNYLTRAYDIPNGKVQLVRVPYFQYANVTSTLTCLPWDGNKGGILVLNARDSVMLNADIDVSGKGFKGGIDPVSNPPVFYCYENQYFYPQNPDLASGKGEGIAIISDAKSFGKGALANGGGSGNSHNSGGGGGGNAGTGGFGGYNYEDVPCNTTVPFDNRGLGGKPLTYNTATNKIFMGGGGGAGHTNNPDGFQAIGGTGSGIVMIITDKLRTNSKKIIADGNNGTPCSLPGTGCHEGMGGGGAGGTVLLNINSYLDNTAIEAKGGKGADMIVSGFLRVGPGGGGSAGLLWLTNPSLPVNVVLTNTGGPNGVCTGYGNSPWGATAGQDGASLLNLQIPVDNIPFKPNIDSVRLKDSVTGCNSFDFKGFGYTNTNPVNSWQWFFGDGGTANTQNASHTYASSGTYIVKLIVTDINGCRDSITVSVPPTPPVTPSVSISTGSNTICKGISETFTAIAVNGGASPAYQWLKNGNPVGSNSSSYTDAGLNDRDTIKCRLTSSISCALPPTVQSNAIIMSVTTPPSNLRYPTLTTFINQPVQLQARNLGGNSYNWQPVVGLSNPLIINPVLTYSQTQEYTIYITIPPGCQVVDTQLVKINGKKGIYVPKAFSPNGDGTNDRLYPILVGIQQLYYFRIYNRWGNLIFETNSGNPASGWDGKYKGFLQPVETYTWVASGIDIDGIVIKTSGNTILVR